VDGSIKICNHTTTPIGHVTNFEEVFKENGTLMQTVSSRYPGTDEYCSGCLIEGSCSGQCEVTREVTARSVGEQRQRLFADMCDFYRKVTEALALDYLQTSGSVSISLRQNCTL
jgi:radical SAM protein with 4Fe4S-binding SPASM domain